MNEEVIAIQDDLNPLPAALRERRRYLIFEVLSGSKLSFGDVVEAVWNSIEEFIGELETGKASVWVVKDLYDSENQRGAVKVSNKYVEEVRASLSLIKEINDEKVIFSVLGVTGTLKSARSKYFEEKSD